MRGTRVIGRTLKRTVILLTLYMALDSGQAQEKNWTDEAERELAASITNEPDPAEKLAILKTWKEKYPDSEFKNERTSMFLVLYAALDMHSETETTAREVLAENQLMGSIYLCRVAPELISPSTGTVDLAADAAGYLIAQATLVLNSKAAGMTEAAGNLAKAQMQAVGYKTLGWVGIQRSDYQAAEDAYVKALELNPGDADLSLRLALTINQQQKPDRQSEIIYHFIRAASYEGPGSLTEETRSGLNRQLTQLFSESTIPTEQLDSIRAMAKVNPLPPPDFAIQEAEPASSPSPIAFPTSTCAGLSMRFNRIQALAEGVQNPSRVAEVRSMFGNPTRTYVRYGLTWLKYIAEDCSVELSINDNGFVSGKSFDSSAGGSRTTAQPPREQYQTPAPPISVELTFEDFETYYRRHATRRRTLVDGLNCSFSALFGAPPCLSTREQLFQQWLAEQDFKLREQRK